MKVQQVCRSEYHQKYGGALTNTQQRESPDTLVPPVLDPEDEVSLGRYTTVRVVGGPDTSFKQVSYSPTYLDNWPPPFPVTYFLKFPV